MSELLQEDILLAEYLSTKLCHDLAGNIGAIANSVELISEPALREQAEELLKQASSQLMDRIQFFRKLYSYTDINMTGELYQLLELAKNYLLHRKIKLLFDEEELNKLSNINNSHSKIIINVIYLCSNCLISGGEMNLSLAKDESLLLFLRGRILKFDQIIEDIIFNAKAEVVFDNKIIQAIYTSKLINKAKYLKFSLEKEEKDQLTFKLTKF